MHYTTNSGAVGIIQSQSIWATHYNFLNDALEHRMMDDVLCHFIEPQFEKMREINEGGQYYKNVDEIIFGGKAKNLIDHVRNHIGSINWSFVASFCIHESEDLYDNGLLSQWRGYGIGGGCAIEIDESALKDCIQAEKSKFRFNHIFLSRVDYGPSWAFINTLRLEGIIDCYKNMDKIKDNAMPAPIAEVYKILSERSPLMKSSAFKEETEVRIIAGRVASVGDKDTTNSKDNRREKVIKFRDRAGLPVPYIELFDNSVPLPIKRILVGPQSNQRRVKAALELCLAQKGINAPVELSGISYLP